MSDQIDELEEGEGKKGKLFIIIGLVLVLLLGGVGAGYYFYSSSSAESDDSSEEVVEASEPEVEKILSEDALYIQVGPVISNIFNADLYQYVQLTLTVVTRDKDIESELRNHEIRIRQIMHSQIRKTNETLLLTEDGLDDVANGINKALRLFLRQNEISDKYITDVFLSDVIVE